MTWWWESKYKKLSLCVFIVNTLVSGMEQWYLEKLVYNSLQFNILGSLLRFDEMKGLDFRIMPKIYNHPISTKVSTL